jgi:hypothetical protein
VEICPFRHKKPHADKTYQDVARSDSSFLRGVKYKTFKVILGKYIITIALGTVTFGVWLPNVWAAIAFCCFLSMLAELSGKD